MTDLELNRRLALAIGWTPKTVLITSACGYVACWCLVSSTKVRNCTSRNWKEFSFEDGGVIYPIAEKYRMFPEYGNGVALWSADGWVTHAKTPQKAIALAVVNRYENLKL